jgi:hypothetical protein
MPQKLYNRKAERNAAWHQRLKGVAHVSLAAAAYPEEEEYILRLELNESAGWRKVTVAENWHIITARRSAASAKISFGLYAPARQ